MLDRFSCLIRFGSAQGSLRGSTENCDPTPDEQEKTDGQIYKIYANMYISLVTFILSALSSFHYCVMMHGIARYN